MASSYRLRSCLLGFFSVVLVASEICVEARQDVFQRNNLEEISEEQKGVPIWPWDKVKFKCPSPFGSFSDPDDCSSFFVCVASIATHRQCKRLQQFDKFKRTCVSFLIAVCDDSGKGTTTTKAPKTGGTTPEADEKFTCPSMIGSFLHPTDCKKYYTCTFFIPSLKTCSDNELFDGVKKQCRPAKEVHCGTRTRPTDATTVPETTTEITTSTIIIPTITERETTTPATTTAVLSTTTTQTPKPRVTAPDTHCDVDDLDCIIEDLGETPGWFVCETDMGSYPHPTSKKLFIFCLNWKPSVKKCAHGLVFSEDVMTCVSEY